ANSIVHSKKNHGVGGRKNTGSSIPLRDEDFKLAPYIMVNPDRVEKGSWDASGRESIRFIKNLSNGYVIVVEKEQKNSPDDMETITMWAEKSSRVADARSSASPAIDVQNVITSFDAAKIRKDGETASKDSEKIKPHRVWHGSGAEFDAFDHSHMGEGEGAQAYGWGTYVTEVEGIGRAYARSSGGRRVFYDGREVDPQSRGTLAEQCYAAVARRVLDGKMTAGEYIADRLAHYDMQLVHLRESGGEQFFADTEKLRDVFASMDAGLFELVEGPAVLYEVEIPDNDGGNYLQYDKQMGAQGDALERIDNALTARGWHRSEQNDVQVQNQIVRFEKGGKDIILRPVQQGRDLYAELENGLGGARAASEFLRDCGFVGIVYPAEYRSGGRIDGAKDYVIFDEGDLRIEGRTRLLRTSQGEVYGFVKGGKIYLDPRIATAETAVHEYTHLWCAALRAVNPAAWSRLKEVLLGEKDVVDYVKRLYPELAASQGGTRPRPTATPSNLEGELGDELMEEVMAHYSGKRGAERLRREREREMSKANGILSKARVTALFDRLRRMLDNFWLEARHLFAGKVEGVEKLGAADFADMALGDLLRGFNPAEEVRKLRGDAHKAAQLRLVTAVNPMEDTYHTGIRSIDDIKTFAEAVDEGEGIDSYPDFTEDDALGALERGRAVVYSSYPIAPGVFVSMSRMEAEEYAGGGEVYSMEVPLEDVAWIYASEGQYAPVEGSTNGASSQEETTKRTKGTNAASQRGAMQDQPMFHFAGERGAASLDAVDRGERILNRDIAEQMEREGKDARAIKFATGWERGKDGKWRYEIMDFDDFTSSGNMRWYRDNPDAMRRRELLLKQNKSIFNRGEALSAAERQELDALDEQFMGYDLSKPRRNPDALTVEDFVDAKELFAAYPELRDVRVKLVHDPNMVEGGSYSSSTSVFADVLNPNASPTVNRVITINTAKSSFSMDKTMAHELQHAIQEIEGFARGGSVRSQTDIDYAKDLRRSAIERLKRDIESETRSIERAKELIRRSDDAISKSDNKRYIKLERESTQRHREWLPSWESHLSELRRELAEKEGELASLENMTARDFGQYRRLAGEVEARNAERRMGKSAAERRGSLAEDTEDVSRGDQIVHYASDENMKREGDGEEKSYRGKENLLEDDDIPEIIATFVPADNLNKLAEPIGILENADAEEWVERHKETLLKRCRELAHPQNVLDPDAVRNILQLIGYNGRNVPAYKKAGNILVAELFKRQMAEAVAQGNPSITFMSGIGGAGKGTTLRKGGIDTSDRGVVYDAAFNDMKKLFSKMEEAAAAGMTDIEVMVVHNDALTAFQNTVNRGRNMGRFLGVNYFLESYRERKGLVKYIAERAHELGVHVTIRPLDNAGNASRGKMSVERAIAEWDYNPEHYVADILKYLNDEIQQGRLTENQIASVAGDLPVL
ncbi:MAG: hypothetical protein IJV64_02095, partial [Oscillospiraceae bacterium]|nr:hypothetical protein [Oscillospiraceae bacterium]